ncbi:hypothetical protein TARUN_1806 [Trichoderma arundinaceum]|uniref:Heterokaryon incompatibility domain-containing protein n=1 Tax=Trichoderma arundinaceum TaxID=490622 RepID=A0A395NXA7_TRIAR|nr:hypothetical protein TARUN_1806 [Trichoderma arundinaceum]
MPKNRQNVDDACLSLGSISDKYPEDSFITKLVDIQSSRVAPQKSIKFIENLECLDFPLARKRHGSRIINNLDPLILKRKTIDAFQRRRYVALSYPWQPPSREPKTPARRYLVEERISMRPMPSPVRGSVLSRAIKYMKYVSARYLWIDQHCIDQRNGEEKEVGMQTMDRVYSLSKYPVALLSEPIERESELQLLVEILTGHFIYEDDNAYMLSDETSLQRALEAIQLLKYITSDVWFSRGWIFQENYRAGIRMTLLIPIPWKLNKRKPCKLFGYVNKELCINSADFHKEASRLCLAYKRHQPPPAYLEDILSRAGKYTVLLQSMNVYDNKSAPTSMTPTIIEDILARDLTMKWDRLPIIANCCQYSERLDSTKLQARGHSLSLSILTLCLINGEILSNHRLDDRSMSTVKKSTITEFLKMHMFDRLQSPSPKRRLTFNKGCRFNNVKLTKEGVETTGHLWRLEEFIPTARFSVDPRSEHEAGSERFSYSELSRLKHLVDDLSRRGHKALSKQINRVLRSLEPNNFAKKWQIDMARNIVAAISQRKTLCVAKMVRLLAQAALRILQ